MQREVAVHVRPAEGPATALAVVLHGGKPRSHQRPRRNQLAVLRLVPFARSLHSAGRAQGLTVVSVIFRFRGWNDDEASPVDDVREVLARLGSEHGPLPVALVGHSMGARAGLRAAGEAGVRGVVALAPWLPEGRDGRAEPVQQLAGRQLLVAHGDLDRWTDPRASLRFTERAAAVASRVGYVSVTGDSHPMLKRRDFWHALATAAALEVLDLQSADANATNVVRQAFAATSTVVV